MLLALVMTFSMALTGAPMHVHAADDIVVTVGASGCDYTTINDALDAIAAMSRSSDQRAVIEIQPGNYEEMLYIELDNITLRNASSTPSIALTNKGVDIDDNAVRITHYYGHGYNYYSMDSNYRYSDSVLASNKSNGSASTTNPGAGSSTHWNATVVIAGNNFIAEDIIFENSFNQYISAKAAADTIVKTSSAKEGSTTRASLPVGSTAVQDKAYVERAAALAIKNKAENAFFDHCKFVGRQDTLYGGKPVTAAFYDCEIYGACDYIFGGMTAVFAKCELVFNTSENSNDKGYITASQTPSGSRGMLFYNCHITSTTPGVDTASAYASKPGYLGRPWAADTGEAIFYYTQIDATCSYWSSLSESLIYPEGWLDTLGGESKLSGEYGTVEASGVDNSSSRVSWATGVDSSGKLYDGSTIAVSTFLGSWNPFSDKDMTIVTDGTVIEPEETAPEATTSGSSGGTVTAGSYVHNFTENGKTSDFYSITGNTSTSKGSVSYNGLTLTTCLKMESSTNISFTAPSAGTLTLVFGGSTSASGKSVKINGTSTTLDSNGILTMAVTASSYAITKGDSINLFYMVYTPEGSGDSGESGGTEETVTATGTLNMSSVTVTKAAGAADPTSVDTSLLSGLTMTVSYSDGTSASVGLSDLVISDIKTHDTLGNYIDVDYNDPVTATKVHCYILVTIEEEASDHTHSYTESITTAATCTTAGVKTFTCSCGASYTESIAATGHSYSDGVCTVCGVSDSSSSGGVAADSQIHNFTDDGFTSTFYTFAGDQVTNGKHGTYTHDFGSGTETLNYALKLNSGGSVTFTPTADGTLTIAVASSSAGRTVVINNGSSDIGTVSIDTANQLFVLTVDVTANVAYTVKRSSGESGLYYIAYIPASSGGDTHTHSYTGEVTTAATCTTAGVKTFTCSCGEGTYTEEIPALGHTAGAAATCTTAEVCTVCNATITAALGHTEQTVAGTAATCTATGLTEGTICSVCQATITAQTEIPALGHSYTSTVTAPTCTAQGYTTHVCARCDDTSVDTYVAATGHTEVTDAAVAATCTTAGLTEGKHCSVCNEVLVAQTTVAALGHTNAAAVRENEKAATCGADGSYESVVYCSVCKAEISRDTVTVPSTGAHVYAAESERVAATCTADGYVIMACGCGATQTTTLTATGHTEVIDAAVAATCTTAGLTEGKHCSVCNEVLVAQTTVAALGHKDEVVVGNAASCTETGLTDGKKCSVCGVTTEAQTQIPALGHSNAAAVQENEQAATCTVDGSYESVVYCSVCNAEVSREKVTVKAEGHSEVVDPAVAATCTATGLTEGKHCGTCGEILTAQTVVAALGHNYKDGVCTVCGAADPEYVPTFTVSGSFVSHGKATDAVTIELILEGQTEAAYSFVSDGAANSGDWSIAGVATGNYTVKVSKADHVTREYELTVGEENVTGMNVEVWLLGDMNGDGLANGVDYGNVLLQVKYPERPVLTDYNRQCADANGDGEITFWDYLLILWHMKGSRLLW